MELRVSETSAPEVDWSVWMVARGGEPRGARRQMFMYSVLEWGPPISEHTSKGFRVREAVSYGDG